VRKLNPQKVFVQYRDTMKPYEPVMGRKYTITHSDTTAELFVFVAQNYAKDQITKMRGGSLRAFPNKSNVFCGCTDCEKSTAKNIRIIATIICK
jgi:hypothetical protein